MLWRVCANVFIDPIVFADFIDAEQHARSVEHVAVFDLAVVHLTVFLDEHLTVFREHIVGADE